MLWVIFLVVNKFFSSSDGCSRLCPCRQEIENVTQRLVFLEIKGVRTGDKNCTEEDTAAVKPVPREHFKENNTKVVPQHDMKSCPAGWEQHAGSCYFFQMSKEWQTQDSPQKACDSKPKGSSLVAIDTGDEHNFLKEYLNSRYSSVRARTTNDWWTSGKKINGQWLWTATGGPISSDITWSVGEPNGQTCVGLWPKAAFNISDLYCSRYERQYICEI